MKTIKRIVTFLMALIMVITLANPIQADAATNVKLNKTKATLTITNAKKNPSVTLSVKGVSKKVAKKAKWSTSNKAVATVKNGKVTAKKAGKATITCKVNKKKLTCKVTVVDKRKTNTNNNTTTKCTHDWKEHWAVFETSGTVANDDVYGFCRCGIFSTKEAFQSHYMDVTLKSIAYTGTGKNLGLHNPYGTGICDTSTADGMTTYSIHTDYVDYMYCTKCNEKYTTTDLPEYWND